jgi:glycosyltransferase involved in cell wall biosynthesis
MVTAMQKLNKTFLSLLFRACKSTAKLLLKPKIGVLYHHTPKILRIPASYKITPKTRHYPIISIVTPSFNQGKFLGRTISSLLDQKYSALEYIIQDGGSTDETVSVIQQYQSFLKHWESKKDLGQSNAINLGFQHATGDIMAYLNSDDILLPGTLHYVANFFMKNPDIDVVYGHRILIDENDNEIGRWVLPRHDNKVLTWTDYVPQETLFWRRRIWEKIGGQIDENFQFAMDWDLLLRFKDANAKFVRLPRFLGAFRIHSHQKTLSQMTNIGIQEIERLRVRCHGRTVSQQEINSQLYFYKMKHLVLHKLYQIGVLRY